MKTDLDKAYQANKFEDKIYKKWEESGYFNPDNLNLPESAPTYSLVLPPPNITDKLHIGHASVVAIEDLFVRYHRLKAYRTLWIPGTDHAAIATQNVVEKKILKEEGLGRQELGREEFLKRVWQFLEETQSTILKQIRKMGASIDWSREAFTLDEKRKKAVNKMFVEMYREGIIYQGERVINWCPRCQSTLSDDELEYQEQKTILYTFKYDSKFPISISTTRPETKLGDTAIAVNPKDQRFKKYLGKTLEANFCGQQLKLKIIADHQVEMDFGTGALGVTPAHSMTDYQMSIIHHLESIKVISEQGQILPGFGKFSGKDVLKAREMVVENLKDNNLMIKEEEINNNLSICYRCNNPIEPLPSKQWFVSVNKKIKRLNNKSLKERALEVVEKEQIKFIPERFTKRYLDWINNLHDWCISRQIWFGHQIPVWYHKDKILVQEEAPSDPSWRQDPDTLDTWFSSGMWTFSTLGWPDNFINGEKKADLKKFHPTQMLETGYEIITLWISRMIMMSIFALNEIPFEKVYLNGMVLDEFGKKMSKSKGNGIDPLEIITSSGSDALRLSLLIGNTPGNDVKISEKKIISSRNFLNKLWNISRFIISSAPNYDEDYDFKKLSLADKWILSKLEKTISQVEENLAEYKFSLAGEILRDFTWDYLADWYLEIKKFEKEDPSNNSKVLIHILKNILKLWHPFIPFITELIWENLSEEKLLMVSSWPLETNFSLQQEEKDFDLIREIINSIRNARSLNKIEPQRKIKALILSSEERKEIIEKQKNLILNLKTGVEELQFINKKEIPQEKSILITIKDLEIYLLGAFDEAREKQRREKEIENLKKMINFLEEKLSNQNFLKKAPEVLVEKEKERLKNCQLELKKLSN